jgi:hypothetical protein
MASLACKHDGFITILYSMTYLCGKRGMAVVVSGIRARPRDGESS